MNRQGEKHIPLHSETMTQVFCAALSGFIANKDFFGPISQGDPKAAVDFAEQVVLEVRDRTK